MRGRPWNFGQAVTNRVPGSRLRPWWQGAIQRLHTGRVPARHEARLRGTPVPRCRALTARGGGATDPATNIYGALRVCSGSAVAIAGEVADLPPAGAKVAAAARRRRRGPHRQD